jgi:peroxidase
MAQAVATDPVRAPPSSAEHGCFVNSCDSSVEHDDAPELTAEKGAGPKLGSLRGFEAVDAVKARVEAACNATVSCADVLALASRGAVSLLGGPTWTMKLGRKDARGEPGPRRQPARSRRQPCLNGIANTG